jgi:hypothetical protein
MKKNDEKIHACKNCEHFEPGSYNGVIGMNQEIGIFGIQFIAVRKRIRGGTLIQ